MHEVNVAEGDAVRCGRKREKGDEWMGWFVPNNDIGYLICNRRQYRLATPHFIPPARPSRPAAFSLVRASPCIYYMYLYTWTCIPIGPQDKVVDSKCHLYGASEQILFDPCSRTKKLVACTMRSIAPSFISFLTSRKIGKSKVPLL